MKWLIRLTLAFSLVCLPTLPSAAAPVQQRIEASGDAAAFVILFPALKQLPAPHWLQEGLRLTYYTETASVGPDAGTGSGAGYTQYDVVAVDKGAAVVNYQFYLDNGAGGLIPSSATSVIGLPAVGDMWLQPTVLKNAERVAGAQLSIVRSQHKDGSGQMHRTVRFTSTTDQAETVWEFDQTSGVLVYYRHRLGPPDNPRQLADSTLVRQRQRKLPWRGQHTPAWLKPNLLFQFAGTYGTVLPDGTRGDLPYVVSAKVGQKATRWSTATFSALTNGAPGGTQLAATGVGQLFGGLWLPAEALKAKPTNPLLDRDPITGVELTWAGGANRNIVLTERGAAYETSLTYDAKQGALLAYQQTIKLGTGTTVIALQRQH